MPPENIQATGYVARLAFKRHPLGQPTYWAKLFDVVTGEEKGFLEGAQVRLIDEGVKISGWDGAKKPQVWWCLPLTPEQSSALKATLARLGPH
jgi:hypothetical protein